MKVVVKMVAVVAVLMFLGQGVFASDKGVHDQGLHDELCELGLKIKEEIIDILDEYKDLSQTNQALKDAGASYQQALTAGERDLSVYTTQKQQAAMSGVYTFDAGYAALFLRKKELGSFLEARKNLNEKIGFTMPLSPKMKNLIENPESIRDFNVWADALDEAADKLLTSGIVSDKQLNTLVDMVYGMIVEGIYVVTESIALADYPPQMLELMNHQHDRIDSFIKLLNTFRGDEAFETAVAFDSRFDLIGDIHNLMVVSRFTQREVDGIRNIIGPERQAILDGKGR
jgi:hypothetical protein